MFKRVFLMTMLLGLISCSVSVASVGVFDDIFDAVVGNSFRKVGKHADDISDLRKTADKASDLIKKSDIYKVPVNKLDDVTESLRKINFPINSKYIDTFKTLSKSERLFINAVDDITSKIAKLPDGSVMINKIGRKGILLSATYGEESLKGTYRLAKNDDLWSMVKSVKNIDESSLAEIKKIGFSNINLSTSDLRKLDNLDSATIMEKVLPKYGLKGQKNFIDAIEEIIRKTKTFVVDHKKGVLIGGTVAVACLHPEWILDPLGEIKNNIVNELVGGICNGVANGVVDFANNTASSAADICNATASSAANIFNSSWYALNNFINSIMPNAPNLIKTIAFYCIAALLFLLLMFIIPITRPIPVAIYKYLKNKIAKYSKKAADKIEEKAKE